ncbi:MAG: hypothetical protein ACO3A4_09690 [Silvanigrellaceae bacterium]
MLNRFTASVSAMLFLGACAKNQYDLQVRLMADGKEISAPRLLVVEGEKASIIEETANKKTQIDVVANELNSSLTLDVTVSTAETNGGNKTVHNGNFLLNIANNQKATINFEKDRQDGNNFISLFEVIAKKSKTAAVDSVVSQPTFRKLTDLK